MAEINPPIYSENLIQKQVCFYFQIHQPYRINLSDSSNSRDFFTGRNPGKYGEDMRNESIFNKVAINCYIPTTKFWINYLKHHPKFKFSISFSGTFLEQCMEYQQYGNQVLSLFQDLIATDQVEVLDETYYHSLAFLVDLTEYLEQIKLHRQLIKKLFNVEPKAFRNTELIYNNHIGEVIRSLGYETILLEDAWWKPKPDELQSIYTNQDYNLSKEDYALVSKYKIQDQQNSKLKLFFRSESCSNGLMFIAKDPFVPGLISQEIMKSKLQQIGIFTDYEFLGEHHTEGEQAVLNLENQLNHLLEKNIAFKTVSEATLEVENFNYRQRLLENYDCPEFTSWGHKERDITVWRGGDEQEQAFLQLESLYWEIQAKGRLDLMEPWRKLSTSCHFYFLGNKEGFDKEYVDLFSPYESVSEALDIYLKVLYKIKETL